MSTPAPQANEVASSPAGGSTSGKGATPAAQVEGAAEARKVTQSQQNGTPAVAAPAASASSVSSAGGGGSIARKRLAQERAAWRRDHPAGFSAKYAPMADGSVGQDIMKWICKVPGKKVSGFKGLSTDWNIRYRSPSKAASLSVPLAQTTLSVFVLGR